MLAVDDGVVIAVSDSSIVTGIHVSNLFDYNCIMIGHADGTFSEYVHVAAGSMTVGVGQKVARGQVICKSGASGFCPQSHLHLQMHASSDKDAPTIPFCFNMNSKNNKPFIPRAGEVYFT